MGDDTCWYCGGEGGFHDCGEDCCMCLDPEEITELCPECHGEGFLPAPEGELEDEPLHDQADPWMAG